MMSRPIKRNYTAYKYGQLHYRIAEPETNTGDTPLICFHMSPYSSAIYENFISVTAASRQSIAIDTPGFGNSDPTPQPPLIEDYASAMSDALDNLGISKAHILGFHTGSKVALALASQRPDVVQKIVMISIAYWTQDEISEREVIIKAPNTDNYSAHLQKAWAGTIKWSMPSRSPEMLGKVFYAQTVNPAIIHWGHQAAYQYNVEQVMPKITQPVLVLNPEDDLWLQTPRIKHLLKNNGSQFIDLPGWAHGFLDLKTQETVGILNQFLDS